VPTPPSEEARIEIDLSKLAPIGLIPLLLVVLLVFGFGSMLTKGNDEVKESIRLIGIKVDSLSKSNENLVKLVCDQFDPNKVKLTDLKCL
jgi:hypothetical protein